jgi:hypothetical protein
MVGNLEKALHAMPALINVKNLLSLRIMATFIAYQLLSALLEYYVK